MKRPPNDFILGISQRSLGLVPAERLALIDIFFNCDEPLLCTNDASSIAPQLRRVCLGSPQSG